MTQTDGQPYIDAVRAVLGGVQDIDADGAIDGAAHGDGPDSPPFAPDYGDGPDGPPAGPDGPPVPANPIEASAGFAENDHGNGQRFAAHFGDRAIWVPRVGWFVWDGRRWLGDPDGNAARVLAHNLTDLISREITYLAPSDRKRELMKKMTAANARAKGLAKIKPRSDDQETELELAAQEAAEAKEALDADAGRIGRRLTFAKSAGNSAKIDAALKEGGIKLLRPLEVLDAQALDINTRSGVLRVEWVPHFSGIGDPEPEIRLISHASNSENTRDLLMTKIMDVDYDHNATCPKFDAFLEQIQPDPVMRAFLLRWFGLCMTAVTGEQKLCFFYGMGANGKSVLIDLIWRIMGDYAATAKIESLTGTSRRGGGDATPDLVPLIGARFVRASEPDEGVKWQEGLIKDLTGGEPIMVRALHSDFVQARPVFKLTISGNHKPDIRGTDDGIWRRLLLIPFDEQIPKEKRIPKDKLDAMLFAEAPGILNRMIEGLLDYMKNGLGEPQAVIEATEEFRAESDPFGQFLTSACVVTGDHKDSILASELVEAFNFWRASPMGGGQGMFTPTVVAKALAARAERWKSPEGKRFSRRKASIWYYDGLRLNDVFGRAYRSAPRDQQNKIIMKGVQFDDPPASAAPSDYTPRFNRKGVPQ